MQFYLHMIYLLRFWAKRFNFIIILNKFFMTYCSLTYFNFIFREVEIHFSLLSSSLRLNSKQMFIYYTSVFDPTLIRNVSAVFGHARVSTLDIIRSRAEESSGASVSALDCNLFPLISGGRKRADMF